MSDAAPTAATAISTRGHTIWCWAQILVWAAGMFIWGSLFVKPDLGLHLLWNVLLPLVPALLVLAPGVWRNVCPLGSMSLAPHHLGISQCKKLSVVWRGRLYLGAFVLLMLIVPLRKVLLDTNGPVLAVVLGIVGLLAIGLGLVFNQKSGWCSSLCPVYPVELLYGSQPLVSVANAHCPHCVQCVAPCSESTASLTPTTAVHTRLARWVGIVLTGCFPGFVWGWHHVPTYSGWEGISRLHLVYGIPFAAGGLTLALFFALRKTWPTQEDLIARVFTAAAITTYYWFRLPAMFGIGDPDAAMIVDISRWLPSWSQAALRICELAAFSWLIVGRNNKRLAWERHPPIIGKSKDVFQ